MERYLGFINGEFVDASSGRYIDVVDPATEEAFSQVPEYTKDDTRRAIHAARDAQKAWRRVPACERAQYMKRLAARITDRAGEIGRIISREQGKQVARGTGECLGGAELMEYHAEWARRIEGELIQSDSPDENIILYREPVGVVGCILPWNFPIYVLIRKLAPALITGNTVVMKPSSETPCSALALAELIKEIGLPQGVVNIITGRGSVVGHEMAASPDVGFVTVTGSTEAGQQIMKACADNITKVSLELGGKAPAIVMKDADMDLAVTCIKNGRISNAGQVCNCVERVYVQREIADEFILRIVDSMKSVRLGVGLDNPDMGPLVSRDALERIHGMVERATAAGAKLLTGGRRATGFAKGYFYEPTVLTCCSQDSEIMQQEIFGPVMPIMTFNTVDEALALANDCRYGLTSTLYTTDYRTALRFSNEIESGELYINQKQGEAYQGYHAGWKLSGIGGDDGRHGMEAYLKTRIVYMKY
jgi:lactaldehyde dehydrogenase/glycolaldehyde dehydrogenase